MKNKGRYPREILTLGGKLTLHRTLLVPESPDEQNDIKGIYPLDEWLMMDHAPFKSTHRMMAAIAKEGIRCPSYPKSAREIQEKHHVTISAAQVKRMTDYVGDLVFQDDCKRAEEARASQDEKKDLRKRHKRKNDVLYLKFDDTMVEVREEMEGSTWRECRMAMAFNSSNFRRWTGQDGREYQAMHGRDIVGIIGSMEAFRPHVLALAKRNGYDVCSEVVVMTDGTAPILPFVKELFPGAVHILDRFHARENASRFADAVMHGKKQKAEYARQLCDMIDKGDVEGLLEATEPYKDWQEGNGVQNFHAYVERNRHCMDYPAYEAKGYLIGISIIEECHEYVMQNRMKQPGQRWNTGSGQGVLSLKCRYESGKWNEVVALCRADYANRHHA